MFGAAFKTFDSYVFSTNQVHEFLSYVSKSGFMMVPNTSKLKKGAGGENAVRMHFISVCHLLVQRGLKPGI